MIFKKSAKYYDDIYDGREELEIKYIENIIKTYNKNTKTILDLGCGTGRHAVNFAKKGYLVTGIDASKEMLEVARQKSNTCTTLDLMSEDARNFCLNKKFDTVISLFQTISYMLNYEDLQDTFEGVNEHLNKEGIFIFDCFYGPAVFHYGCPPQTKDLKREDMSIRRVGNNIIHTENNTIDINFDFLINDKEGLQIEKFNEKHTMRYFFNPEIEHILNKSGFELIKAEEWLTGKQPSSKTWAVTYICKKVSETQ